jgi:hypothetical protein
MADATTDDNDFGKELAQAWATDDAAATADPDTPIEEPAVAAPKEEPTPNDPANQDDPNKKEEPETPPAANAPKEEEKPAEPKNPETPPAQEQPQPLTKDDLRSFLNEVRTEERTSGQAIQNATDDVLAAYYPEGLSNVLIDQKTGKELRTPQDVVDASGGEMDTEEATQWLMNEQFRVDKAIEKIKDDARSVAETTTNFKQGSMTALQKYEPLFQAYPQLQAKVFDKMMKLVKADEAKGVILSAPDPLDFYDDYLEPYQMAYEHQTKQSATNPVPPAGGAPAPAQPGIDDRLDDTGDGGQSPVDDPNDFAQQVKKELSRGF